MFTKKHFFANSRDPQRLVMDVVREVCEAINSPRSLAVWLMFVNDEHNQLLELSIDASRYQDSQSFADDYLVTSFLSKADFLKTGIDTKQKALDAFWGFEKQCGDTNRRLKNFSSVAGASVCIIHAAVEKMKNIFKPLDSSIFEELFSNVDWGPGVTSSAKGKTVSRYNKLQAPLEATADLVECGANHLVNSIPAWACNHSSGSIDAPASVLKSSFTVIPGNTLTTVPKNAKTDRTIAVEPHVNAVLQRSVGIYIRDRLRELGCNLRSQKRNQDLARKGSIDGSLATIDLKGASDTISRETVRLFVPHDWLLLIENARSKHFCLEGKWYEFNKHSSMGNGYTFELESAIFFCVALATCEYLGLPTIDVSVYGDDIIIPSTAVHFLTEALNVLGFTLNHEKSFSSGPFRESCGADFFYGVNVRPFFIRSKLKSLSDVFTLGNLIRGYAHLRNGGMGCDSRFKRAWNVLFRAVPKELRFFCPPGYGNAGFITEFDEATPGIKRKDSSIDDIRGYLSAGLIFCSTSRKKENAAVSVASALWDSEKTYGTVSNESLTSTSIQLDNPELWVLKSGGHVESTKSSLIERTKYDLRGVGHWRRATLYYRDWPTLGGWI